eukprot:1493381-Pyramimonas_sp.AAC.1
MPFACAWAGSFRRFAQAHEPIQKSGGLTSCPGQGSVGASRGTKRRGCRQTEDRDEPEYAQESTKWLR